MAKKEHSASVIGSNLDISKKHTIEIGNFIRGRLLEKAKTLMEGVIVKKVAVPFKIFNMDVGHKKGRIAAGRYPVKAATRILGLLNSAESNAEDKGLDIDALYISEFIANKGNGSLHHGRHRGRAMKRTHIKIVLEEKEKKKKVKEEKKK
ncbi:50S ribosomal protein L22 [archaeon]|jgi:large subunit ribosomal protein L22|nr:50S ribosomal protein L22 [archaeon]MBT4397005.1 50S ribosomal protein L22 [archaeon]MBT4440996.1 50S ribosomal protein L22 [archaeon]